MFRPAVKLARSVEIEIDGETVSVPAQLTLAAALLMHDFVPTRINRPDGSPRAPHCLMGACFECLIEIDGVQQRACQVEVRDGMRITRVLEVAGE